ncbi:DUF2793 domain-containing protein [Microvirga guangxiensis]|uniref:DUF2793 domain-containing protein n=1 Tax=Microvirga guangxiensis TaxID=549386 RepID=A0A1G5C2A1_9HYPH|nr:DUF2793 domain-containing protein [Microvirga guangxiensis]SCX96599.1 Protein of unknown function [Microvirga guangxiensis]
MTSTPHLALPLLAAAQAQKHVTHNEAIAALDALVHLAVKERGRTSPPATPAEGDRYLVGAGAAGAFSGQEAKIALFDLGSWRFFSPRAGWKAYVEAEGAIVVFDGAEWQDIRQYCNVLDGLDRLGIGTAPDDLNRLSAKLNAALFAALSADEGGTGDLRFVLNKSGAANVLSQLYQRGFSGRAETGLIGNDDFSIRVSPDGSRWIDALSIDRETGVGTLPQGLSNVPRPNLLINSSFVVNQRGFAGGSLAEGVYSFDRWKGGEGGCALTRAADGTITLTGALDQVVDVVHASALLGVANLAGMALTISVRDPSEPLPVVIGTKTATIPSGSGVRSATVVLDEAETGHVTVRLKPSSPCSFRHVKLEAGAYPTPWIGEPLDREEFHCRRYYQMLPFSGSSPKILCAFGQRTASNVIDIPLSLSTPMRASPALETSAATWVTASPVGNQIAFYSNSNAAWLSLGGTLTFTTNLPAGSSCLVMRLQAGSAFNGSAGSIGNLHLGNSAFLALQAEL